MQQLYSPDKFTAEMLATNKTEYLQAVDKPYNDLLDIAEELESTPGMVGINGDEVERIVNTATQSHQQFLFDFNQKLGSACASPNTDNHGSNANLAQKSRVAEIDIRISGEKVDSGVKKLRKEISKYEDWSKAPSHEIEIFMNCIASWEERLQKLQDTVWTIRRDTEVYNLDTAMRNKCEDDFNSIRYEVEDAIEAIRHEDKVRALYSLNQSTLIEIEYPGYEGKLEEDFMKFKKEFIHALKVNRVRAEKQVAKLRECLSGGPKELIPATMTNLNAAFDILSPIYGDSARLIKSKKMNIQDLGEFPEADDYVTAPEARAMIEWYVKFEHNLEDLKDLAAISDDHNRDVFNLTTYQDLLQLFNLDVVQKLSESTGSVEEKVEDVYNYAVQQREKLQRSLQFLPDG